MDAAGTVLPARITQAEFLGGHVRYRLNLLGGLRLLADEPHLRGCPPLPPGTEVRCSLDPTQVGLLRG
jgi:iron(III) transport system ATP-binding protein